MSVLLRRLAFGCFWFGIFWIALLTIGGGVAGSIAGAASAPADGTFQQGFSQGQEAGFAAGVQFRQRYGVHVVVAAALLATVGTFSGILPGTRRK